MKSESTYGASLYWTLSSLRRYLPLLTLFIAIAALYFYKLDGVGVLDPDEPRYSAIGRNMAKTGEFVTPMLWGSPWFEKPPLLYWMTAAGTAAGLSPDLSGRVPVALLSLCFLGLASWLLAREFGLEAGSLATVLLGTSAGWIAFSDLALTDLPLASFYSVAVFLCLPLLRAQPSNRQVAGRFAAIGASIGLAALAKGLVPIALALPFCWFLRRYWRQWFVAISSFLLVAAPWYVAVYVRNGNAFVHEFFFKHHFERLYSASLQHVQPPYYYFPVLVAALFPWTPFAGLLMIRGATWDTRRRFLAAVVGFGFLFFTISLNKLPGYLLPLVPSAFALIASQLEGRGLAQLSKWWLLPCASLIALVPLLGHVLPQVLGTGRINWNTAVAITRTSAFYIALPLAAVLLARRSWAIPCLALCVVSGGIYLKEVAYPAIESQGSARGLWRATRDQQSQLCDAGTNRTWLYGIAFYRESLIPGCGEGKFQFFIHSQGRNAPTIEPFK